MTPSSAIESRNATESAAAASPLSAGAAERAIALHREETERALVERARNGDREAFGELVRAHRDRAFGWATALTRDACIAEDIVQDALIRAFLHLGTLADSRRFVPWLQRIVRNQAYMKLRRGGPFGKERPWSGLDDGRESGDSRSASGTSDWGSVDAILFRLSRSAAERALRDGDPSAGLLRRELLGQLGELLHCLSRRERGIFEAHFFGELPPAEIAKLFDTSTANVYNVISRSRAKVQRERIRVAIRGYVAQRAEAGLPRVRILAPPPRL